MLAPLPSRPARCQAETRAGVTEESRDLLPQRIEPALQPSPVNVLIGVAIVGSRAGAGLMRAFVRAARPAVTPAEAVGRVVARSRPAGRATSAFDSALGTFDLTGRRGRDRVERAVLEAVDQAVDRGLARFIQAGVVERITAEVIAAGVPERVAEQVADAHVVDLMLETAAAERIVEATLASPALERLITRVLESSLYDEVIDRVLASQELWRIVEEIAHSPEVLDAISAGSASLANEMAGQVRRRTVAADEVAERIARRLLRRAPRPPGSGSSSAR
jgi:hypothetical protein